jgi:hypothetical protein
MNNPPSHKLTFFEILFLPFGCLLSVSPLVLLLTLAGFSLLSTYIYYNINIDFFGMGTPDYNNLQFDPLYNKVNTPDGRTWRILYEKQDVSTFAGIVRNASPIRLSAIPFLTHDILVTSGDFADPDLVSTSVSNHRYTWFAPGDKPRGRINLVHAVPANEDIYRQLLKLRDRQQATLKGREILRIEVYNAADKLIGGWEDSGCNTMLVTSVENQ